MLLLCDQAQWSPSAGNASRGEVGGGGLEGRRARLHVGLRLADEPHEAVAHVATPAPGGPVSSRVEIRSDGDGNRGIWGEREYGGGALSNEIGVELDWDAVDVDAIDDLVVFLIRGPHAHIEVCFVPSFRQPPRQLRHVRRHAPNRNRVKRFPRAQRNF